MHPLAVNQICLVFAAEFMISQPPAQAAADIVDAFSGTVGQNKLSLIHKGIILS